MSLPLEKKIALGFASSLLVMLLVAGAAIWSVQRLQETFFWVDHNHGILNRLEAVLTDVLSMQTSVRGFVLTGDDNLLRPYDEGAARMPVLFADLQTLLAGQPAQFERLQRAREAAEGARQVMRERIAARRERGLDGAAETTEFLRGQAAVQAFRDLVEEMKAEGRRQLDERFGHTRRAAGTTLAIIVAASLCAIALTGLASWRVGRDFRRRREAEAERDRFFDRIGQLNTALAARAGELEAVNRELESFSYSISHDLRAPLRHIDSFAGLLARRGEKTLDTESRGFLNAISRAAKHMGVLIDDLLAFSRMGRIPLRPHPVAQDELVAAVLADGYRAQGEPPILWEIGPLPSVQADGTLLRQVWANLIDNAVKYSRKKAKPRIEIGGSIDPARKEYVFFVRDNGVGFDMAYADKLFGIFQRLHDPLDFEGTGIGLANVRRIVTRHGGRTWAEGQVDAGATFYFSLPLDPPPPPSGSLTSFKTGSP